MRSRVKLVIDAARREAVIVLLIAIAVLALTSVISARNALAAAEEYPPLLVKLTNNPVVLAEGSGDKLVYVESVGGGYRAVYAVLDLKGAIPRVRVVSSLLLPAKPSQVLLDSLLNPKYVFVVVPPRTIVVWDLESNKTSYFGVPYNIESVAYVNLGGAPAVLALTDSGHLFAIVRGTLGWYEAGDIVGSLLSLRREGVSVTVLIPVLNATSLPDYSGLALVEVEIQPIYVPVAKLHLTLTYNSSPVQGAIVYGYYEGEFTYREVTSPKGDVVIPLPWTPQKLNIIVNYNGTCKLFMVNLNETIKAGTLLEYPKPLDLLNATTIQCIEPKAKKQFYIVGYTYPPTFRLIEPGNLTEYTPIAAYIVNKSLHVWYKGRVEGKNVIVEQVYDIDTLKPSSPASYAFYNIGTETASKVMVAPEGRLIVLTTEEGHIYLLSCRSSRSHSTLEWAYWLGEPIIDIKQASYSANYIVAAVTASSKLLLVRSDANITSLVLESRGANGGIAVELPFNTCCLAFSQNASYLAFGSASGLYLLRDAGRLIVGSVVTREVLDEYMVRNITVKVVNEDGEPVNSLKLIANLTYNGRVVLTVERNVSKGLAVIPCAPTLNVTLTLIPYNTLIYKPVKMAASCTRLLHGYTITVPYKRYNLTIRLIDEYTGGPPARNLTLTIVDVKRNITLAYNVTAGTSSLVASNLPPGLYMIRTSMNSLYEPYTTRIAIPENLTVNVKLPRKPVRVIIYVSSTASPLSPEPVEISVYNAQGSLLYKAKIAKLPAGEKYVVTFLTKYRGPVRVEAKSLPSRGSPFYAPTVKLAEVGDAGAVVFLQLKPALYRVVLEVMGVTPEGLKPIEAEITVRMFNGSVYTAKVNGSIMLMLWKGVYNITITPSTYGNSSLRLFETKNATAIVEGNNTLIRIELKQVRIPSKVLVTDGQAIGGIIVDELTVYVDGVNYTSIPPGKPRTLTIPLLVNGSTLEITSKHKVYNKLKMKVKPQNRTIIVRVMRKAIPLNIKVVDEFGKPLISARVDIKGIDVAFSTTLMTGADGTVTAVLPAKANYEVCASMKGYYNACTSVLLSKSGLEVKLALRPTIVTLILERYLTIIIGVAVAAIVIAVIKHYLAKLAEKIAAEEEF